MDFFEDKQIKLIFLNPAQVNGIKTYEGPPSW